MQGPGRVGGARSLEFFVLASLPGAMGGDLTSQIHKPVKKVVSVIRHPTKRLPEKSDLCADTLRDRFGHTSATPTACSGGNLTSCVALGRLFGLTFPRVAPARAQLRVHALWGASSELRAGGGARFGRLSRKSYLGQRKTSNFLPTRPWAWHVREGEGGR